MKKIISVLSLLSIMTFGTLKAQNVEDVLDVKSFNFQGVDYQLGWSAHNSDQCIQEYFPKGQTPEKYIDMFTISIFTNIVSGVTVSDDFVIKLKLLLIYNYNSYHY